MFDLELHLLGPPLILWENHSFPILRRQARHLLFRLAVQAQPTPREHLCFLFWPDIPDTQARRNLSHLLTHLRQALPDDAIVQSVNGHLSTEPELLWSDTQEFSRLYQLALTAGNARWLEQAVLLYRGPFLDGVELAHCPEYESWALIERCAWERHLLEILISLIDHYIVNHDYSKAISFARQFLSINPLDESVHRRLIQLYAARGDRAAAVRQFQECARMLQRELGVRPLPETVSVYRALGRGQLPRTIPLAVETRWALGIRDKIR